MCNDNNRQSGDLTSNQDALEDNPATLERGVAVLRASGRLLYEDDELDRALVLAVVDAVFPLSLEAG